MTSTTLPPLSLGAKVFAAVGIVLACTNLIDFAFYGQAPRNLFSALGLALIAYGLLRNDLGRARLKSGRPVDRRARAASLIGAVLLLASFLLRFAAQ